MSKPLTATQIRCLSAGKFIVGGITGLYLKKSSKTSGFFYLRFSDSTGRHEISLGLYPDLSLADARAAAAVARADLARGKAFTCTLRVRPTRLLHHRFKVHVAKFAEFFNTRITSTENCRSLLDAT